ncbi:MAG: hypothetical protein EZS28_019470 [Streblomastix strix]|uniref:Uncharacterized protein n=1 Tax=Streblomastix strix TaxID=222440 RepID=A0A5J4VR63_9EUKA|nr:MAG: hypothetical protein EZS28_019470 [Streblomastix strix]
MKKKMEIVDQKDMDQMLEIRNANWNQSDSYSESDSETMNDQYNQLEVRMAIEDQISYIIITFTTVTTDTIITVITTEQYSMLHAQPTISHYSTTMNEMHSQRKDVSELILESIFYWDQDQAIRELIVGAGDVFLRLIVVCVCGGLAM